MEVLTSNSDPQDKEIKQEDASNEESVIESKDGLNEVSAMDIDHPKKEGM
jgi:hypothetical protein